MTNSTVASTVETDALFEKPESPEDRFHTARALLQRHLAKAKAGIRGDDAESMTTVDMKSRAGTVKSTGTCPSPIEQSLEMLEKEIQPRVEIVGIERVRNGQGFDFKTTTPSPITPGRQCDDVEKMMFEMCAQSGYRRVNVGVAF